MTTEALVNSLYGRLRMIPFAKRIKTRMGDTTSLKFFSKRDNMTRIKQDVYNYNNGKNQKNNKTCETKGQAS